MALNDITVYQTEGGFVVEFGGEGEDSIARRFAARLN